MSEKPKKVKNKMLLPIVLIAIVIVAAALIGLSSFPIALPSSTADANSANPAAPGENPPITTTGVEMASDRATQVLPYFEDMNLEAGRYTIDVTSDIPVWIMLYDEDHFMEWQNEGKYMTMKAGTGCCALDAKTQSFSGKFDISKSEAGKFYIVMEGNEEATVEFRITQTLKFD